MSDERPIEKTSAAVPDKEDGEIVKPQDKCADALPSGAKGMPKKLTAAEQMALYEEKLKEEDWGHQPC